MPEPFEMPCTAGAQMYLHHGPMAAHYVCTKPNEWTLLNPAFVPTPTVIVEHDFGPPGIWLLASLK
jgi:hypothetical protein